MMTISRHALRISIRRIGRVATELDININQVFSSVRPRFDGKQD